MQKRGIFIIFMLILILYYPYIIYAYNFRNQTEITTSTWQVFNTIYGPGGNYPAGLPKEWPTNNATDSDVIANFSASTHLITSPGFSGTPISSVLDWAKKTNQGVDIIDLSLRCWIRSNYDPWCGSFAVNINTYIPNFVSQYANNPAYRGVDLGDEPYGYELPDLQRDLVPSRANQVFNLFRQYDTNRSHRYYFNTVKEIPVMRHCREANPDIMLSSGAAYLHDPYLPNNGSMFQAAYDSLIRSFDEDYECTENYGIPYGFSLAANNWAGKLNPDEARMATYLMLAHGGKFVLWFVYGTNYGLVWENNNPLLNSYFTYWSPSFEGGRNFPTIENMSFSIDNTTSYSGSNSLKLNTSGNSNTGNALGVTGAFPYILQDNVNYTLSAWLKSNCTTCGGSVMIQGGTGPQWIYILCPLVVGVFDWTKASCNFKLQYNQYYNAYLYMRNIGNDTGDFWFDDISLYDNDNGTEILKAFNPGFEVKYGQDRKPDEPSYSALRKLNFELKNYSELASTKKIEAFDNINVPAKSIIKSIDVSSSNNFDNPRIEYGLLADNDTNGTLYLVLVNRVIVDDATITVKLRSCSSINLVNLLTNLSIGTFFPANNIITFPVFLKQGEGIVLRLEGLKYNKEREENLLYYQDFNGTTLNEFTADPGFFVVNVDGNNMLFGNAVSSQQNIWLNNYRFLDFVMTGNFKIQQFTPGNAAFFVGFRQQQQISMGNAYILSIWPDPAQYQNGRVAITRNAVPWNWYTASDQKFLSDTNVHSFKIKALGGKIEAFVDDIRYLSVSDNYVNNSGFLGISVLPGNQVYFDNIIVKYLKNPNLPVVLNTNPVNLLFNGASYNITITDTQILNATASSSSGNFNMFRDGFDVTSESGLNVNLLPGTYKYMVNSTGSSDYIANSTGIDLTVTVIPSNCAVNCNLTLILNQGINLISLPLIPSNNSINYIFGPVLNNVNGVYYYDSSSVSN